MTSWILTIVAALYWMVEGDAKKAIDCLRLSLTTALKNTKGQWDKATMLYESTLGLQSSFEPALQRLKAIKCKIVTQKPVSMTAD